MGSENKASLKVYISGQYYDKADAKISVYDHGFLYGDGVFEGLRSYRGKVFRLEQHLDRLWHSARAICLEIPLARPALAKAIYDTLKLNQIDDGYIRLVVCAGPAAWGSTLIAQVIRRS